MPSRTPILAAGAAALALLVAACGGGSDRPSANEVSERILEASEAEGQDITEAQADCIAQKFVDSEISDDGLEKILEDDSGALDSYEDLDISDEDKEAATAAGLGALECIEAEG